MSRKQTNAPAEDASGNKPSTRQTRTRPLKTVSLRPDIAEFADEYFHQSRYGSLSRFIDAKILQHARMKRKELRKLKIQMPLAEAPR